MGNPAHQRPQDGTLAWVARSVGPRAQVTAWRRLTGGITCSVHLITVATPQQRQGLVLKRWVEGDPEECRVCVEREAEVLVALERSALPAPRLVACSLGAETDEIPTLLMTRIPGRVSLSPRDPRDWISQMATTLVAIHNLDMNVQAPVTRHPEMDLHPPTDARRPDLWNAARNRLSSPAPSGRTLIHGDYQHFNVLWTRQSLSGVVDWTWAGWGHPDRDVGHCRLNLAVLFSSRWGQDFSATYQAEAGRAIGPWWDIFEICRYSDAWARFIPIQVGGRVPVDISGMTDRVEELLAQAIG
jgi:aminoglycoside phosphotransferase (APT) family kinase protein